MKFFSRNISCRQRSLLNDANELKKTNHGSNASRNGKGGKFEHGKGWPALASDVGCE